MLQSAKIFDLPRAYELFCILSFTSTCESVHRSYCEQFRDSFIATLNITICSAKDWAFSTVDISAGGASRGGGGALPIA